MPTQKKPQSLRSKVLSYRFEVDQLVSDYIRLERQLDVLKARGPGAVDHELLRQVLESRSWRYMRWFRRLVAWLRGDVGYRDPQVPAPAGTVPVVGATPHSARFPVLPDIDEIGYVQKEPPAQKSWDTTRFLSSYYFDQFEAILARPESRGRPVFVQTTIIDWFVPLYQRPQQMALAMARQGCLVFYMTANCGQDRASGFHEVEPNVFITNQPVPMMLRNALLSFYSTVPTLQYWLDHHPETLRERGHLVAYEYIDHIDPEISFDSTPALLRQFQRVTRDTVDLGVASARALVDELRGHASGLPVAYVPNGVDVGHYAHALADDHRDTIPPALGEIIARGRPVVGYFGALAPWLWYEVVNELTRRRPDLSFVFIGPDYLEASAQLEPRDNVLATGAVDYSLLPYFAQHFDVALIPFKPGDIARTTSPLKLFEYFALGTPVVVTKGMDECTSYDIVGAAGSAEEFSAQIDLALARAGDAGFRDASAALAGANSWDARAKVLVETAAGVAADRPYLRTSAWARRSPL